MNKHIVLNQVKCLKCGAVIISRSVHDYKECGCENHTMVDGGLEYARSGGHDMSLVESQVVYNTDDFEIVRKSFCRGSRGIDGKSPLTYVPLCDMSKEYILAVINYINEDGGAILNNWAINLYNKELEYRLEH